MKANLVVMDKLRSSSKKINKDETAIFEVQGNKLVGILESGYRYTPPIKKKSIFDKAMKFLYG